MKSQFLSARFARYLCTSTVLTSLTLGFFPTHATAGEAIKLDVQGQIRHELSLRADDPATGEDESAQATGNAIVVQRMNLGARAKHDGWRGRLLFAVGRGKTRLLTGQVGRKLGDHFAVTVGQTKRLLSAAYRDSSRHQRLPERVSLADGFDGERDIGVVVRFRPIGKRLDIHVAAWNGAGANVVGNETGRPMLEARIDGQIVGSVDPEAAKIGNRFGMRAGVAGVVGQRSAVRSGSKGALTLVDDHVGFSAECAVRLARVEARFEALWLRDAPVDARSDQRTPLPVSRNDQLGLWAQLAWQPTRRWEFVARWARHDKNRDDSDRDENVVEAGASFRPDGDDDVKLQLAWRQERDLRPASVVYVRNSVTTQLQLIF